ncbi:MAG: hypothetical protein RIA63_07550, partial [Cyclobacteriaceae bacterium]
MKKTISSILIKNLTTAAVAGFAMSLLTIGACSTNNDTIATEERAIPETSVTLSDEQYKNAN